MNFNQIALGFQKQKRSILKKIFIIKKAAFGQP
jgi:hypothetical protein